MAVTVIGAGNCGTALAWAMHAAGIQVAEVVVRRNPTAGQWRLAQDCGARLVKFAEWTYSDAQCCWLCVPDDCLAAVAAEIAARITHRTAHREPEESALRTRLAFLHTSGARSFRDLAPLAKKGFAIGAAHPFRSFPQRQRVTLAGTYFGVEGDRLARETANGIIRQMDGVPFRLRTEDKAMYHAFGAFASPLLVSLLAAAAQIGTLAGVPASIVPHLLNSLTSGTFANWQQNGAARSFSGPIARGDIETIRRHLASLSTVPELDNIYRALASYAAATLPAKRSKHLRKVLAAKAGNA